MLWFVYFFEKNSHILFMKIFIYLMIATFYDLIRHLCLFIGRYVGIFNYAFNDRRVH